ncbi:uncharacterized protein LOC124124585 [Haliotis rufescens]|uniref:uncharacterized protein LOC124124585 n=1 Tax=Haliotis rufescens TaxID=6454 RepID=UPI00201F0EBC|nr:uncharacterized protein LOC124124585 [Haliotis rufescens]
MKSMAMLHTTSILLLCVELVAGVALKKNKTDVITPCSASTNRQFLHELRSLLSLYLGEKVLQPVTSTPQSSSSGGGAMFTRWGKTTCPSGNDVMYKGYAGGSHYTAKGGPGTTLCLPDSPIYAKHTTADTYSQLYGTEYETLAATGPLHNMFQHDVPCVVCRSRRRRSAVMVPARNACFPQWHLEYKGYLFGGATRHSGSSDYVCVDEDPESIKGGHANKDEHLLYLVESICGSLPCPPYVNGWEMTCAVCTK